MPDGTLSRRRLAEEGDPREFEYVTGSRTEVGHPVVTGEVLGEVGGGPALR